MFTPEEVKMFSQEKRIQPAPFTTNTRGGALALGAAALGAFAIGAFAVGALAVGALAIRKLAVRSGHIDKLSIGELTVDRLVILDSSTSPETPESSRHSHS
jgi:hypothetical protein